MNHTLAHSREMKLRRDLAAAMHAAMKSQQLTQTELAKRAGVHMSHISSIMNEKVSPKLETIAKIESGLGVPIAAFTQNDKTQSLL